MGVVSTKATEQMAAERLSLGDTEKGLGGQRRYAALLFSRLKRVAVLREGSLILDLGAGTGGFVVACQELGYVCLGVEPSAEARSTATALSAQLGVSIEIVPGVAEDIPYPAETFDLVHANSVLEHIVDLDRGLGEIFRVLKPGGVLWFYTASAVCPRQREIRGFPLFGWYPDRLKRVAMRWATEKKPHLVGHTRTPAVNWFTPRKARVVLRRHGFRQVYDRWDLRGDDEGGRTHSLVLRTIRLNGVSRTLADMMVPDCSYAAIK